jgi:hypothetical protein
MIVNIPYPVVPPAFVSAEIGTVNGSTVAVTFDAECVTAPAVTIKENGVATTNDGGTIQGDAHIVYYIIPIPWHGSDDVITVDDNPCTNNIAWVAELDLQADTGVATSVAPFAGTGTVSQSGNAITGVGTAFLSEVVIGDVITGTGINGAVTSITDDTNLTLSSSTTAGAVAFTITPQAGTARVTTWADQSINNHDFTATGTARPSKQTIGGTPFVIGDAADDWLTGDNFFDNISNCGVVTVWMIRDLIAEGTNLEIISKYDVDLGSPHFWIYSSTSNDFYDDDLNRSNNHSTFLLTDGQKYVTSHKVTSYLTSNMFINGNDGDTTFNIEGTPITTTNDQPVHLVAYSSICLAASLMAIPAPPSSDRAALEQRLADRYGVTLP